MPLSSTGSGLAAISADLERVRDSLPAIAQTGADALRPVVDAQLAARETPYGETWPKPKRPPTRAYTGERVDLAAEGTSISATLDHEQRKTHAVIPTEEDGLPLTWTTALDGAVAEVLGGES